jgi:hypothetical protein
VPRAVLAAIDTVEARERTPVEVRIDLHVRALRLHARRQRHVLVVGAVRGFAPQQERFAVHAVFGPVVGVVVVDLVIVPGEDPGQAACASCRSDRSGRARGAPGSPRGSTVRAVVLAHVVAAPARLVDVVAEEHDEVRIVGDDVAVGAEVALLVLLAGSERESHAAADFAGRRRGARASDAALRAARGEAVPVPALGSRPSTSTWTECSHSGCAIARPSAPPT